MIAKQKIKVSGRGKRALLQSMNELDGCLKKGMAIGDIVRHIKQRHPERVRVVLSPPKPRSYPPAAVKKLRGEMGMSQATFAKFIGVSCILVQGWERGVRTPSPLACRLLDTISRDPRAWLANLAPAARTGRRAG